MMSPPHGFEPVGEFRHEHEEVGDIATAEVRDVTEWTFPDGTPCLPQEGTLLSLHQTSLDRSG